MGIYEAIKDGVEVARRADNIDVMRQLLDALKEALDLVEENRQLKASLDDLERHQRTKRSLVFKNNAYWDGEEGPFCSRCFDADQKTVRLHTRKGVHPWCPSCGKPAVDPNDQPPQRTARPSSYLRRGGY